MLYIEHNTPNNNATLSIQLPKDIGDCSLCINPNMVRIELDSGSHSIKPCGIALSCVTCSHLQEVIDGTLSCGFTAKPAGSKVVRDISEPIKSALLSADSLICKFCHSKIVNLKGLKEVTFKGAVYSFEENHIASERFFCHSKSTDLKPGTGELPSVNSIDTNCTLSSCLMTGVELAVSMDITDSDSYLTLANGFIHCSRCLLGLGRIVQNSHSGYTLFWTNSVNILSKETDVDGDFLRYIEQPLVEDADFYALLLGSLVDNQCYRVILSAVTANGCLDFMLLWLFDQEVRLYATALQKSTNSPACTQPDNVSTGAEDAPLELEPVLCRRVFYAQTLPNSGGKMNQSTSDLLTSWQQDFGVALIRLPWETCLGIAACLGQFTNRIAPHLRKPEHQSLAGFTCGAIPVVHLDSSSKSTDSAD